jgi:DNA-binding NarL/FixJ family response regulator
MTKPLRVLLLEDSESDAKLIRQELQRAGLSASVTRVDNENEFAQAIARFGPHVVLSDHALAAFGSSAALTLLRTLRPATPFIVVTGAVDHDKVVEWVRAGADDVILKEKLHRLAPSIETAVASRRPLAVLTPRQTEILKLVAEGHRTRDIATRLNLSIKTVESHRSEIMKRLEIHDVVGLVRYAVRIGLVSAT